MLMIEIILSLRGKGLSFILAILLVDVSLFHSSRCVCFPGISLVPFNFL